MFTFFFLKKKTKCSFGLIECSFDNRARKFLLKARIFSDIIPKKILLMFFKNLFFPKCSRGHVESTFDNPVENSKSDIFGCGPSFFR